MRYLIFLPFLLAGVYAATYIPAPTTITNVNQCYYISNAVNKTYICQGNLSSPCFYDLIVKDSKNIDIYCSFNKILIYNSTNVRIFGNGTVITWKSSYVTCTGTSTNTSSQTSFLICVPQGVRAWITVGDVPLGALGEVEVKIISAIQYSNLLVTLQSSCPSYLEAASMNTEGYLLGNHALIRKIKPGEVVIIKYRYIPEAGRNCKFYLDIKSNASLASVNATSSTTGSVRVYYNNNVYTDEKFSMALLSLISFILLLLLK